ncbi:unnamed protein product [Arctia plantaginis]|uniref:Glucose-1-phosphatase n=1 Tax=Arctia plantaginis TaxID=874455 RepID=A0A8S1BJW7_ARCPL|nr:unnamed protein product [Arctia plantaginis]
MSSSIILIFLLTFQVCSCQNLKIEQVLILSRHNVRTPLSQNLHEFTPKPWPNWKEKSGYLTAKGALLEGFMGEFFSSWLIQEGVLAKKCPDEKSFYVYANIAQRTMASADAFISKAFPLCNITIHHTTAAQKDPIFNPVIHNASKTFKIEAVEQMQTLLNSFHFQTSEECLENILDYKASNYCLTKQKCDLVNDKNKIFVNVGFKPNVEGPLKVSKSVIDSFIMENYEGLPIDEVAWGRLKTNDDWNLIMELSKGYHNVIFNTSIVAEDLARPLLTFIKDLLINRQYKVTLLMGHDANIYTVLKSLRVKPYVLNDQYEKAPAGGKIVFQKWMDKISSERYLRIDYVYQTTKQMREGKSLSMINPPDFTLLELEGCEIDANGFCPWNDFVNILNSIIG